MNSGEPPTKDSGEPFSQKLRPTQLIIKANSWNEFRPSPHPPGKIGMLKIKANSSIQVNPSAEL